MRQARILERVESLGRANVDVLAETFGVSLETMRRDLNELAENGAIQRVHGAAVARKAEDEAPFADRLGRQSGAKRLIAEKAKNRIRPGDTVFIDTGTTTLEIARAAAATPRLTVITNSTQIAAVFSESEPSTRVFLLGGWFDGDNSETRGPDALAQISGFQADVAVLTVAAIAADAGAMDADYDEASVARAMIENAGRVVIAADSSKFERRAPHRICALDRIEALAADRTPPPALAAALAAAGVETL